MLVKWMRCTVSDRRGFERAQRKWAGLLGEPGFRGQGGGWSRSTPETVHIFGFWDSRAFYDSFMARSHDRLQSAQVGTYSDLRTSLFEYRFDVKTGFRPEFSGADLLRVAHCTVREDRIDHYTLMQEKVWNPAMAGSPGMVRGVFAQAGSEDEFLVLSMWDTATERGKYRTERVERLAFRAQTGADITAIDGDVIDLEPEWTIEARQSDDPDLSML
ncbi:YdbC family protein [Streptomyces sp. XM4193]|uniref:YdbC family protein n=1 Tax=Streptomyces sp. XM4193 TaxID=2929782 RepID=UPI001FFB86CE|nr:YdbC family protein [Streptomyces sp. XM4193]MCK1798727.1 YdbC family protein [Streptomyces sp. XM4193]